MGEKHVTAACVAGLTDVQACVLWLELLFPGGNFVCFLRALMKQLSPSLVKSSHEVDAACAILTDRGYLKYTHRKASVDHRAYKPVVRFETAGLAALRNLAVERNWMPKLDQVTEAAGTAWRYATYEFQDKYGAPKLMYARTIVLRALLGCSPDIGAGGTFVSSDMAFDGASFLTGVLADGVRPLAGELQGNTEVQLLPASMAAFFCAGRDVGPFLDAIRKSAVEEDVKFPGICMLSYAALRIWRGESMADDRLDEWLEAEDVPNLPDLEAVFCLLAAGKWESAQSALASIAGSRVLSGGNVILIPFLALAYAVAVRCGAHETKIRKVAVLMNKSVPPSCDNGHWSNEPLRDKVVEWARARVRPFDKASRGGLVSEESVLSLVVDLQPSMGAIPLSFALQAPCLASATDAAHSVEKACSHLAQQALKVVKNGYPLLSGVFLSGCSRFGSSLPDYAEAADMYFKSGVPQLLPSYDPASEWKGLVAELAKLTGIGTEGADTSVKGKSGTVVWALCFNHRIYADDENALGVPTADDPQLEECLTIVPCFRGPRAPSDGSKDKSMTPKGVSGKLYRDLLTEQDRKVLEELFKAKYDSHMSREAPWAAIEALVDHPHVVEGFEDRYCYGVPDRLPRDISLTRLTWNMTSSPTPDGGLVLSLPKYLKAAVDFPRIVRFGLRDFRFLKLSERERKFVSGFFAVSASGRITLPQVALSEVSPVLSAMAKVVPMEGDFAVLGGASTLERLSGESVPTARLEMQGDVLSVSLCVKPLGKNPSLVLKPGVGSPERMIRDGRETKVLVRDLAAEKSAAARVTSALADFESWAKDEGTWEIADLADSLSALAALKDLGEGAVRLEWREGARLTVSTTMRSVGGLTSEEGAERWFRVDGAFKVDENVTMSLVQLLKACRGRVGRFVPFGERAYARLSAALLKRLEALEAAGRERDGKLSVSSAALPMLDGAFGGDGCDMALPRKMKVEAERVRTALSAAHRVSDRLKAALRPYQEEGYVWLSRLCDCGYGACLADDMGLGKTVQLIALLLARAKDGASLVIAPTSVCGNWRREIARFAPTLRSRCTWELDDEEWREAGPHDVVITSYGLVVSREEKFRNVSWNGLILDEAQAIKNEVTERARVVKTLSARFRVAATGTPIENRLTELWSIFDFLNPGLLGSSSEFVAKLTAEGRATPALKNLVRPLILRRLKRDVLDDLPEKTEITLSVPLEGTERAGYEACRRTALETLEAGGKDNRISILAELTRLRRYCCHPSLVLPEQAESAKMEALVDLLRDLKGANHRVLVFSQFTDYLALVEARMKAEGITYQYLDGTTPPQERERRVADFQRGEGDVFLMSLKAGGTGLNLTAANYVILLDPWWNPAVEDQAADRVHRIGQRNPVTVYRLVAADTVEERVLELHVEKKQLATDVLEGTASSSLTPETLMGLFG